MVIFKGCIDLDILGVLDHGLLCLDGESLDACRSIRLGDCATNDSRVDARDEHQGEGGVLENEI